MCFTPQRLPLHCSLLGIVICSVYILFLPCSGHDLVFCASVIIINQLYCVLCLINVTYLVLPTLKLRRGNLF